jgi:hypothetical protein
VTAIGAVTAGLGILGAVGVAMLLSKWHDWFLFLRLFICLVVNVSL